MNHTCVVVMILGVGVMVWVVATPCIWCKVIEPWLDKRSQKRLRKARADFDKAASSGAYGEIEEPEN